MTGKVVGWGVAAAMSLSLALGVTACGDDDSDGSGGTGDGSTSSGVDLLAGVTVIPTGDYEHVEIGEPVEYLATQYGSPPVWGTHWFAPGWADCGFYTSPVPVEAAVHSLEHGIVWLAYQPTLPAGEIAALEAIAAEEKVVVSPVDGLRAPSWPVLGACNSTSPAAPTRPWSRSSRSTSTPAAPLSKDRPVSRVS